MSHQRRPGQLPCVCVSMNETAACTYVSLNACNMDVNGLVHPSQNIGCLPSSRLKPYDFLAFVEHKKSVIMGQLLFSIQLQLMETFKLQAS